MPKLMIKKGSKPKHGDRNTFVVNVNSPSGSDEEKEKADNGDPKAKSGTATGGS